MTAEATGSIHVPRGQSLWRNECGASFIEYAILAAVLASAGIIASRTLGGTIEKKLREEGHSLLTEEALSGSPAASAAAEFTSGQQPSGPPNAFSIGTGRIIETGPPPLPDS